ncbi:hypothetical protein R3I93_016314 [Phoxinus phoxinus]|uniref:Uncharacterized protein n=1 Tax=Phoxinus phoxinus TaxID=58324 RepID=A0AAN9CNJ7_9TELE
MDMNANRKFIDNIRAGEQEACEWEVQCWIGESCAGSERNVPSYRDGGSMETWRVEMQDRWRQGERWRSQVAHGRQAKGT